MSWFIYCINNVYMFIYARKDQLNLELLLDKKWCLYYQRMPSVYYTLVHQQFITHPWCSAPLVSGSPLSAEFSFKTKSAPAAASKAQRGTMYIQHSIHVWQYCCMQADHPSQIHLPSINHSHLNPKWNHQAILKHQGMKHQPWSAGTTCVHIYTILFLAVQDKNVLSKDKPPESNQ